ncbi:tRNA(fMet)-specific endonuclease VapC [Bosea caraganae]|uniref:Ribonuclease VapC n=1 Tax=Bosea caraganae TaxID=2763117 RepID=A0A370L3V5_9HYPH|nr:type II toxin-antitoxin system VapC family toxin [Bosea caraganae]RDJ23086.1 tRNA(fMet)-specific endonuclease VapC [Bosea caraganae]RDJ28866.1 tRNA(fMet)-specific endonuclease VapC [Bosea caraganae]
MLDTNICIYVMRTYSPALQDRFSALAGSLCISSVTVGELAYGAEKSARRSRNIEELDIFLSRIMTLPFDEGAARHYGQLRAELEKAGTPCGPYDMQIGAHARSVGLIMVTNNMREFARMPGLRVENWV